MENDNGHMDLVIKEGFGAIANSTNSAGEMFHHPGKAKPGQPDTSVEDGRGASAILWAVRSARVFNFMTPDEAAEWLEYLTADTKKPLFEPYLVDTTKTLIVPTIVLYEVRKKLLVEQQKTAADWFVSEALRHTVVPLDERIALDAANNSIQFRIALADAIIYTTAVVENAWLVTGDAHVGNVPNVTIL
jgi:predicted nucleic acid-binding protein